MPLFEMNPETNKLEPGEWYDALVAKSSSTGAVFNIDKNVIAEEYDKSPHETHQKAAKQLRAILKALNMGFDSNVAGDEFSVSKQLRLLGDALILSGGNTTYRHAKVDTSLTTSTAGP